MYVHIWHHFLQITWLPLNVAHGSGTSVVNSFSHGTSSCVFYFAFACENVSVGPRVLGSQWLISVCYPCCSTVSQFAWFPREICCHPILVLLWVLCLFPPLILLRFLFIDYFKQLSMLWFVWSFVYVSRVYGSLNVLSMRMHSFENIWTRGTQIFPGGMCSQALDIVHSSLTLCSFLSLSPPSFI